MTIHTNRLNKGQSLVELALLLPVFLILAVVTIDLGRGVYYYSVIFNAAREGARFGIVHQQPYNTIPLNSVGIEAAARAKTVGLDQDNLSVPTIEIDGDMLQVTVTYRFELITKVIGKFVTACKCGHIDLSSSSTMLIER